MPNEPPLPPRARRIALRVARGGAAWVLGVVGACAHAPRPTPDAARGAPPACAAAPPPNDAPPAAFTSFAAFDARLRAEAAACRFSGLIVARAPGRPPFAGYYGLADRARGTPVGPATRFDVGSITKMFTAVAVLRLAQDGRLALDDTLGRFLTGFAPAVSGRVTVRMLLRHQSGFGDYLNDSAFVRDPHRYVRAADFVPLARTTPPAFEPGSRSRYSNVGYALLGAVIERVTGRPYQDVLRDLVFRPAGMAGAGFLDRRRLPRDAAVAYTRPRDNGSDGDGPMVPNTPRVAPLGAPDGGSYATAADLVRFVDALLDERLLDHAHTTRFLRRFSDDLTAGAPTLPPVLGFAGADLGVAALTVVDLRTRAVVVGLANMDGASAVPLAQRAFEARAGWQGARP